MAPHSSGLLSGAHMSSSQKASLMRSPKARTRGAGQRRMIARVVCVLIGALTLVLLLYFDKRRVEGAGQSMSGSRKGAHARGLHVDLAGGVQSRVGQVSLEGDVGRNGGMGEQWAGTPKHVDSSDDVAQGVGSGDRSGGGSKSDELEDGKVSLSSVGWFNGGGQKSDELETGSNTQPETVQENSVSDPDLVKRREEVARESVSATEPSMVKDLTSRGQENARALDHYLQRGGANAAKAETQLLSEADANPAATVNTATISNAPFNSSAQSGRIHTLEPIRTELRVYMYDLPAKFNWGLLSRAAELGVNASEPFSVKGPPFPVYQGGLSHQHSPEYWLTIDLLTDPATKVSRDSTSVLFFILLFGPLERRILPVPVRR